MVSGVLVRRAEAQEVSVRPSAYIGVSGARRPQSLERQRGESPLPSQAGVCQGKEEAGLGAGGIF